MKKEILTLIIGILIGAIIATGIFLVLDSNGGNDDFPGTEMSGERPEMGDDSMRGEEPPEDENNVSTDNTESNT